MQDMSGDFLAAARRRFEKATKKRAACRQQAKFNILLRRFAAGAPRRSTRGARS
jgi:hypothetical protein